MDICAKCDCGICSLSKQQCGYCEDDIGQCVEHEYADFEDENSEYYDEREFLYDFIVENIKEGNMNQAIISIEEYRKNWGDGTDVLYFKAFFAEEMGDLHSAIKFYRRVVDIQDDAFAYYNLGKLYAETGNIEESTKWFGKGIAYHPEDAHLWFGQATNLAEVEMYDDAETYFEEAIARLDKHDTYRKSGLIYQLYYNFGTTCIKTGKHEKACESLKTCAFNVCSEDDDIVAERIEQLLEATLDCVEADLNLGDFCKDIYEVLEKQVPHHFVEPHLVLVRNEEVVDHA